MLVQAGLLAAVAAQCEDASRVKWCSDSSLTVRFDDNSTLVPVHDNCTYHVFRGHEIRERLAGQWVVLAGTSVASLDVAEYVRKIDPGLNLWCEGFGGAADFIWDRDGKLVSKRGGSEWGFDFNCWANTDPSGPNGWSNNQAVWDWLAAAPARPEGGLRLTWVQTCFWDQNTKLSEFTRTMTGSWAAAPKVLISHLTSSYYWNAYFRTDLRPYLHDSTPGKSATELREQSLLYVEEAVRFASGGDRVVLQTRGTRGHDQMGCDQGWFYFDQYANAAIRYGVGPHLKTKNLIFVDPDRYSQLLPWEFEDLMHYSNILAFWSTQRVFASLLVRDNDSGCPEQVQFGQSCSLLTIDRDTCTSNYCSNGDNTMDNQCFKIAGEPAPSLNVGCCSRTDNLMDFQQMSRRPCNVTVSLVDSAARGPVEPQRPQRDLVSEVLAAMDATKRPHSEPCMRVWCAGVWAEWLLGLVGLAVSCAAWWHSAQLRRKKGRPAVRATTASEAPSPDAASKRNSYWGDTPLPSPAASPQAASMSPRSTHDFQLPQPAVAILNDGPKRSDSEQAPLVAKPPAAPRQEKKKGPDRLQSLGFARFIASVHIVAGHLDADGGLKGSPYPASWGFTWVPWFFMLSGFVLTHARLGSRDPTAVDGPIAFIYKRLATVYPMYVAGVVMSYLLSTEQSVPEPRVLVAQAWFLQSYWPKWTEHTLQMHCWFLSSMTLYWLSFRYVYLWLVLPIREVWHTVAVVLGVMLLVWLLPLSALASGADQDWFSAHEYGKSDTAVDFWVVFLKFHPLCYFHVFYVGMLLGKLRAQLKASTSVASVFEHACRVSVLASYMLLAVIMTNRELAPPGYKLSARLGVLMPLQALLLFGLAWGTDPLARLFGWWPFTIFEEWSYVQYIVQFVVWKLWPSGTANLLFFLFLLGFTVVSAKFISEPATKWWLRSQRRVWIVPALLTLFLVLPSKPLFSSSLQRQPVDAFTGPPVQGLPGIAGAVDIRLELPSAGPMAGGTGGYIINPSVVPWEGGLMLAARRHAVVTFNSSLTQETVWLSEMMISRLSPDWSGDPDRYGHFTLEGAMEELAPVRQGSCCTQTGVWLDGQELSQSGKPTTSAGSCCAMCRGIQGCASWTWCAAEGDGCSTRGACRLLSGAGTPVKHHAVISGFLSPPDSSQRAELRRVGGELDSALDACGNTAWNICQKRPTMLPTPTSAAGSVHVITGAEDPKLFAAVNGTVTLAFNSLPVDGDGDGVCYTEAVPTMFAAWAPTPGMLSPSGTVAVAHELVPPPDPITCGPCIGLDCRRLLRPQKNWMGFEYGGERYYIQHIDPWTVVKCAHDGQCDLVSRELFLPLSEAQQVCDAAYFASYSGVKKDPDLPASSAALEFHGGSAAIRMPDGTGLALFHALDTDKRRYANYAVSFSLEPPFRPLAVSKPLPLVPAAAAGVENPFAFGSGLALVGSDVVITYGAGDIESRAATMPVDSLAELFT